MEKNSNEVEVSVLENIYCNIQKGLEMGKTLISLQGSSRSGKTFNVMIWLIMNALQTEYPLKISVVRRSLPSLKRSVLNDFKEIMIRMHQYEDKRFNKTEGIYTFRNGSIMEFFSTDDEQKVRGSKRDILFCNEANELTETEFKQLRMRTTKYCIIDYNPSFTEEHWIYPIRYDSRTYHFVSTYRENLFLEQAIIDEIESYKYTNKALWQIYGMGEFAIIEGLVFPKENWDIIEDVDFPDWKGDGVLGIDWGMTCFTGDTLIRTSKGDKPIKDINEGELVLTRNGYMPVARLIYKGINDVLEKHIIVNDEKHIIKATKNHLFNANGKWKKYGELTETDNLFVLSNSMEKHSSVIHQENTQITISINGKKMEYTNQEDFITQFGSFITGLSMKDMIYTTKTAIRSTMMSVIFSWLLLMSMEEFTTILENTLKNILNNGKAHGLLRRIITKGNRFGETVFVNIRKYANGVAKNLFLRMFTSDSVVKNITINGNTNLLQTLLKQFAQSAESNSCKTNISKINAVLTNAHINYCGLQELKDVKTSKEHVYDLSIIGSHEYFANGILVHNCDPTVCEQVLFDGNDVYVREIFREKGLKSGDIAKLLQPYKNFTKYCDIDNRLVEELELAGIPLLFMTKKNSMSIETGIRLLNQRKIHITASSTELIKEFKNYVFKKDRYDNWTNVPIDSFNHGIDALRYTALEEFKSSYDTKDGKMYMSKRDLGICF